MTPSHIKFYNEALDAIEANSLPLAKIAVENSLAEEPYDIESWKLYVIILNALGFDEEASKATARLETLGVTEADRLHLQIVEFESTGRYTEAITTYQSLLKCGNAPPGLELAMP